MNTRQPIPSNARFWDKGIDGKVICSLCPNACVIAEGKHGVCRVRFNRGGTLDIPFYGKLSSISVDPIEKKPLFHYHPGSRILSVGFVGCSFRCKFCQNYHISQSTDIETRYVEPEELVRLAAGENSFGIAYTYSEPLVHIEYVMETARIARNNGIKNVLVSNGYIRQKPAEELLPLIDAANIDLKADSPEFYGTETAGKLDEVKRFISQAAGRIHLEVTTLVIPGKNDDPGQIEGIARFLQSLDPSIPFHLSRYYPQYQYKVPPTPVSTITKLMEVARRHLPYVYAGNVGQEETNTVCAGCGNLLIRRIGYTTRIEGIAASACNKCGKPVPIIVAELA